MAHKSAPIAENITSENSNKKKRYNEIKISSSAVSLILNLKCQSNFPVYLHFLMDFCSSYAGFLNASSKNQMLFTAQINGKNAKPTK